MSLCQSPHGWAAARPAPHAVPTATQLSPQVDAALSLDGVLIVMHVRELGQLLATAYDTRKGVQARRAAGGPRLPGCLHEAPRSCARGCAFPAPRGCPRLPALFSSLCRSLALSLSLSLFSSLCRAHVTACGAPPNEHETCMGAIIYGCICMAHVTACGAPPVRVLPSLQVGDLTAAELLALTWPSGEPTPQATFRRPARPLSALRAVQPPWGAEPLVS
jgi:hypothetical protein